MLENESLSSSSPVSVNVTQEVTSTTLVKFHSVSSGSVGYRKVGGHGGTRRYGPNDLSWKNNNSGYGSTSSFKSSGTSSPTNNTTIISTDNNIRASATTTHLPSVNNSGHSHGTMGPAQFGSSCSANHFGSCSSDGRPPFVTTVTRGKFLPSKFELLVERSSLFTFASRPRPVGVITRHQCSLGSKPSDPDFIKDRQSAS